MLPQKVSLSVFKCALLDLYDKVALRERYLSIARRKPTCMVRTQGTLSVISSKWPQEKLRNSDYDDEDKMEEILEDFEFCAKRQFRGRDEASVKVGSRRDYDESLGIEAGHLTFSR